MCVKLWGGLQISPQRRNFLSEECNQPTRKIKIFYSLMQKNCAPPPPPTLVWKSAVGLCLLQSETESPFKIFSPCPPPTYHNKNLGIQQIHARERALSRFAARFSRCNPERPTKTRYESEASGSKICAMFTTRLHESMNCHFSRPQVSLFLFVWRNMMEFERFRTVLWISQSVFQWGNDDPSTRRPDVPMTLQVEFTFASNVFFLVAFAVLVISSH